MGNYITIPNKKGVKAKLETAYNKHLLINKAQFNNDFGTTNSFEDVFEIGSENQKDFDFKTGVSDKDFYSAEFMQDVQKIILSTTIEIIHDTTDEKHNEFEKEIKVKYFDVTGCNGIYLAKVPNVLKVGDIFNVYAFESTKFGCEWLGNLEDSLIALALSDYFIEHKNEIYTQDDNGNLIPKIWGTNNHKQEIKLDDKLLCGSGSDTWITHVMYNAETKKWHREEDYTNGKVVGSYIEDDKVHEQRCNAIAEVREYVSETDPIMFLDSPISKRHLFCVRGKYCDYYQTTKMIHVYVKYDLKKLNLETDLPYLARLSKSYEEFVEYWDKEADKLKRMANDVFYKFKNDCQRILDAMNAIDRQYFFNFHTND